MIGEREWRIGQPVTKARGPNVSRESSIDRLQSPQLGQEREHRQAEDGEVIAFDSGKQLYPLPLQLVGADAAERFVTHPTDMAMDEFRIKIAHRQRRMGQMLP